MTKIAIVGRPNVGKSALFNRICGRRTAIVDEAEGVTRDRLYAPAEFFGRSFTLIDTGGIDARSTAAFNTEIQEQAKLAIAEADALILVVDGEVGLTELDHDLARLLHKLNKPIAVAVNKIDCEAHETRIHDFHALGLTPLFGVSALHSHNVAELLEHLLAHTPESENDQSQGDLGIALVGRPNVGKSTLLNAWLEDTRSIVSPIAGTTRDQIDATLTHSHQTLRVIDTAGIRKKQAEHEVVDKFAAMRTQRAIEESRVCVLLCDARDGITSFEKRIATTIEKAGKGCVVVFNKWDLVKGFRMEHAAKQVRESNPFLAHCPLIFASAQTGRNLTAILDAVCQVATSGAQTLKTAALNTFIEQTMQKLHPPMITGKRLRIYYMTQTGNFPMRFVLFVNHTRLMAPSYQKYLHNQFRSTFGCNGNPILFKLRGKPKRSQST